MLDIIQDVYEDSRLGRCYIPLDYFSNEEYKFITDHRDASKIDDKTLLQCNEKLLELAKGLFRKSVPAIRMLPRLLRGVIISPGLIFIRQEERRISSGIYKNTVPLDVIEFIFISFQSVLRQFLNDDVINF